jgi:hypothetical protein
MNLSVRQTDTSSRAGSAELAELAEAARRTSPEDL